jgi:hypothetical protein
MIQFDSFSSSFLKLEMITAVQLNRKGGLTNHHWNQAEWHIMLRRSANSLGSSDCMELLRDHYLHGSYA